MITAQQQRIKQNVQNVRKGRDIQKTLETLYCTSCGTSTSPTDELSCSSCGGPLTFPVTPYRAAGIGTGIWRYGASLPLDDGCSLGEGMTPLLKAHSIMKTRELYLKYEASNPTGSFKDRGTAVVVSAAAALGYEKLVIASTGNAGASVAAYAARLGLHLVVVAPDWVAKEKLWQITCFGAEIRQIKGSFADSEREYRALTRQGYFPAGSDNPFRVEGSKTIAYEISEQLGHRAIDRVLIPVGTGNHIVSAYKGFVELVEAGIIPKVPAIDGVQLEAVTPLPLQQGSVPKSLPNSVATGINIAKSVLAKEATRAIITSGGRLHFVGDEEILAAQRDLAHLEGIAAEPTGAVAVAAYRSAAEAGVINARERVVVPITGHLLKQPVMAEPRLAA